MGVPIAALHTSCRCGAALTLRTFIWALACATVLCLLIGSARASDERNVVRFPGAPAADGLDPRRAPTVLCTITDVSSNGLRLTIRRAQLLPSDEHGSTTAPFILRTASSAEVITVSPHARVIDARGVSHSPRDVRANATTLYEIEMSGDQASRLTEYVPRRSQSPALRELAAIPAPLGLPLAEAPLPGRVPQPYFATNAPHVALLNPIASQPQAVKRGTKTYVAYEGPGRDPYVACWDAELQAWQGPYRAGTNPQTWDTHGGPALYVDTRGNVHVFFGTHHQPLLHARTAEPGRIDSWISLPAIECESTYPKIARTATGPLLIYRDRSSEVPESSLHWVFRESPDDGDSWGDETELLSMAYPLSVYPTVAERPDGSIDMSWVDVDWLEYFSTDSWARYNVYYAHRTPSGVWENGLGEPLTLPIDRATAAEKCLVLDSDTELTNQTIPGVGPDGRPRVLFTQGNDGPGTPYRFRFARASEDTWTVTDIAATDHFYDSAAWYATQDGYTAFLTTGGAGADGMEPNGVSGGRIARWTSMNGTKWSRHEQVDPGIEGTLLGGFNFAGLQLLLGGDDQSRIAFQEWNLVSAPAAQGLYLRGDSGFEERTHGAAVTRVAGRDRYEQAAAIAGQSFTAGAETVVVASGEDFADALVAGPLAAVEQAPILLTRRDTLSGPAKDAIRSLHAQRALIIGGPSAVSSAVERSLKALGLQVERIAGRNRNDTAATVAGRITEQTGSRRVFVASGEVFADGASAGAAGAVSRDPILLVNASSVPSETVAAVELLRPSERIVVGGALRVPESVFAELGATERIDGQDRYEVAAAMARWTAAHGALPYRTLVSTGADFPDCLSASVAAARMRAVALLVPRSSVPTAAADVLAARGQSTIDVFVYGGQVSITDEAFGAVQRALLETRRN